MSAEEWRSIPGWSGFYEVSNLGRVRSVDRIVSSGHPGVRMRLQGRVLTPGKGQRGHLDVYLWRGGKRVKAWVHRLVLLAFVGPCPPGLESRHLDGNPANNSLSNLCWGTRSRNNLDRAIHRRGMVAVA